VEANAARAQMTSSAQNLEHALTGFQRAQVDLGEEMSITATNGQDSAFNLPAVKNTVTLAGQAVAVTNRSSFKGGG